MALDLGEWIQYWRGAVILNRVYIGVKAVGKDNIQGGSQTDWCQRTELKHSFYVFACFYWTLIGPKERKCVLCHGNNFREPLRLTLRTQGVLPASPNCLKLNILVKFQRDHRFSRDFSYSEFFINHWNVFAISWIVFRYHKGQDALKMFLWKHEHEAML